MSNLDGMNWIDEIRDGWESVVLYQRWTGTPAVARYSYKTHRFVDVLCFAGGRHITDFEHALQYFNKEMRKSR